MMLFYAVKALQSEAVLWATDVTVPISRLAEIVHKTKEALEKLPFFGSLFGHVGDGNFHTILLCNANDSSAMERVKSAQSPNCTLGFGNGGNLYWRTWSWLWEKGVFADGIWRRWY